ncbi:hypothetical protein [Hydrogenophaga sp.]|uniref:hypothetical protein n=1 Tax=Hydrogenophaga sp. TaxID=1904254 RepID=UPI003F6D7CD3
MTSVFSSVELVCASQQSVFVAGEFGPVWRVVQGMVRLDRHSGPFCQPVQLALPGDLIGTESLCDQPYQLGASAFTPCQLEVVPRAPDGLPQPLLQQALLQHLHRSQDMAQLRTGSVLQRLAHLLALMGLDLTALDHAQSGEADVIRQALPALREVALLVDAKTETVCRALAQLLPPRSRKGRPVRAVREWSAAAPGRLASAWAANVAPLGAAA